MSARMHGGSPRHPSRPHSRYLRAVMMSACVIAVGSYALSVGATATPETDEGAVFGVCVMLAPGFDACRDDDGTLVLGDGLGADGLPLFSTAPAYTEAQ